ncbi:hypothetical protein H5410_053411 [Solanum commersonii]|uniref:Uncharacterized protein n=1 Tax=Solanum commersonii TaxID=4109 RepID=A0A9J5X721_SOLCO|nr:hypothetical protein H5410_053411 [Solanum commersonii]
MKVERKLSVVLVPFLLQGHLTPMLQLGSILHSQGFSVIVAHTQHNAPNYSNHPQFVFHSMDDGLKGMDMSFPGSKSIYRMNESCKEPLRNYLVRMMEEEEEGDQLACIIYDNIMFFVDDVATQLRLPSIVLRTYSAVYLYSMLTILQQPEKYFPFKDSQLLDPLPELHPLRNITLGPFHKMAPMASSTSILEEDNSCIEWLDRQAPNSVLYVSLGSLMRIDDKELIETAWGLVNSDQPFLWVIRLGSVYGFQCAEALPDGFEEMVLAHPAAAGFFTHCGWNSTLESILEEVPLICRQFLADQPVNARYLSQIYKVGFELEVMERTVIEKTIRKLMLSEEGKDVKKRVVDMKQNIVAAMHIDGTSHKNLNDLVDFISALPSRLAPPTPVFGAIMSSNHITSKCIIES